MMARETESYWFVGKAGGGGTGRAITWQGWLVAIVYSLVVAVGALLLAERSPVGFVAMVVVATAVLLAICHAKTPGGIFRRQPPGVGDPAPRERRRRR